MPRPTSPLRDQARNLRLTIYPGAACDRDPSHAFDGRSSRHTSNGGCVACTRGLTCDMPSADVSETARIRELAADL